MGQVQSQSPPQLQRSTLSLALSLALALALRSPSSPSSLAPLYHPLPQHSCASGQPMYYTTELNRKLHRSQGHMISAKRAFFTNFWAARSSTMKPETIRKSFQATGVWPMDTEPVLKRFNNGTSRQDYDSELGDSSDSDTCKKLVDSLEELIEDKAKVRARELLERVEALQVKNKLLREENLGLQEALNTKKKHKTKRHYGPSAARGVLRCWYILVSKEAPRSACARNRETQRS